MVAQAQPTADQPRLSLVCTALPPNARPAFLRSGLPRPLSRFRRDRGESNVARRKTARRLNACFRWISGEYPTGSEACGLRGDRPPVRFHARRSCGSRIAADMANLQAEADARSSTPFAGRVRLPETAPLRDDDVGRRHGQIEALERGAAARPCRHAHHGPPVRGHRRRADGSPRHRAAPRPPWTRRLCGGRASDCRHPGPPPGPAYRRRERPVRVCESTAACRYGAAIRRSHMAGGAGYFGSLTSGVTKLSEMVAPRRGPPPTTRPPGRLWPAVVGALPALILEECRSTQMPAWCWCAPRTIRPGRAAYRWLSARPSGSSPAAPPPLMPAERSRRYRFPNASYSGSRASQCPISRWARRLRTICAPVRPIFMEELRKAGGRSLARDDPGASRPPGDPQTYPATLAPTLRRRRGRPAKQAAATVGRRPLRRVRPPISRSHRRAPPTGPRPRRRETGWKPYERGRSRAGRARSALRRRRPRHRLLSSPSFLLFQLRHRPCDRRHCCSIASACGIRSSVAADRDLFGLGAVASCSRIAFIGTSGTAGRLAPPATVEGSDPCARWSPGQRRGPRLPSIGAPGARTSRGRAAIGSVPDARGRSPSAADRPDLTQLAGGVLVAVALLLALIFGGSSRGQETVLLGSTRPVSADPAVKRDPVLRKEISFYLFRIAVPSSPPPGPLQRARPRPRSPDIGALLVVRHAVGSFFSTRSGPPGGSSGGSFCYRSRSGYQPRRGSSSYPIEASRPASAYNQNAQFLVLAFDTDLGLGIQAAAARRARFTRTLWPHGATSRCSGSSPRRPSGRSNPEAVPAFTVVPTVSPGAALHRQQHRDDEVGLRPQRLECHLPCIRGSGPDQHHITQGIGYVHSPIVDPSSPAQTTTRPAPTGRQLLRLQHPPMSTNPTATSSSGVQAQSCAPARELALDQRPGATAGPPAVFTRTGSALPWCR